MANLVKYQSKVETAKIVSHGVRRNGSGNTSFPMSKKRQSIFGKLEYPNCVSVTVAFDEPTKRDWPDQTHFYDAKKFRIPSDVESFEIIRNSKSEIVLICGECMAEVKGESTTWREGAHFSLGKVARFVYHGILFLLDKFTIPQNEEMFEENYHSLDMNIMLMSKK